MGMLSPLLNRKSDLSVRTGVLLYKHLIRPMMDYARPAWRFVARIHVRRLHVLLALLLVPPGTLVTGRYTRIWVLRCLPTTSEPWLRALAQLADVRNPLLRQLGRYLC